MNALDDIDVELSDKLSLSHFSSDFIYALCNNISIRLEHTNIPIRLCFPVDTKPDVKQLSANIIIELMNVCLLRRLSSSGVCNA